MRQESISGKNAPRVPSCSVTRLEQLESYQREESDYGEIEVAAPSRIGKPTEKNGVIPFVGKRLASGVRETAPTRRDLKNKPTDKAEGLGRYPPPKEG
jgi:hypothetical protein